LAWRRAADLQAFVQYRDRVANKELATRPQWVQA
jgi:hypothetical protein